MKRSYDTIAGVYDILAGIFIGKALRDAQIYLVQYIPAGAKVLIVGGGTGWILEEITRMYSKGLQIDYLDISANMISKASKRNVEQNNVRFIKQSAVENFEGNNYNIILSPFFFDNFKESTMCGIFNRLHQKLQPNGLWLYTDFQVAGEHQFFQKGILYLMYTFFRTVCNIEATHLPNVTAQFAKYEYKIIQSMTFKKKFIISSVYERV